MNARWSGGLLALIFLAVGCNPSADQTHKTVPVTGTVTYKGQSVEGATVTLFAESGEGRGTIGTTDAQGKFTLTTVRPGDGAMVGTYKVSVSKTVVEGASTKRKAGLRREGTTTPLGDSQGLPAREVQGPERIRPHRRGERGRHGTEVRLDGLKLRSAGGPFPKSALVGRPLSRLGSAVTAGFDTC